MTDSPTRPARKKGRLVVIVLVLVCAGLAWLAGRQFQQQSLPTEDARLLFHGEVIATFTDARAGGIQAGCPARVTIAETGTLVYPGQVKMVQADGADTLVMIQLSKPPRGIGPPHPCSVIVGLYPEKH